MWHIKIFILKSPGAVFFALLSLVWSVQGNAHVLLETPQATPGAMYKAVFMVPHGCHGAATTAIKVTIPDGITGVKPMPKPGWTLGKIEADQGAQADSAHANGAASVTWSGGALPDDEYDEFIFIAHVADTVAPGFSIYFPVVQSCGAETKSWTDMPQPGQLASNLKMPAPGLRILAAATPALSTVVTAGFLQIVTPWLRATPGGAKVAGGYLSITNKGSEPDRLMSAAISVAPEATMHEMKMDNGMMQMRELPDGLEIKPGETVTLKPGGYHIMFKDLTKPLKQGDRVEGTLTFAKAGKVNVTFEVGGIADVTPPAGDAMHHMH